MTKNYVKNKSYYNMHPIPLTSKLLDIADMLKNIRYPRLSKLTNINIDALLYKGKLPFLDNSFKLTSIPFISYDLLQKLELISKSKKLNLNSFIALINNYSDILHPFNIPIIFDSSLDIEGGYSNPIYLGDDEEIKQLIFTEFVLTDKLTILTPGIYAHEIVHSQ